jgi:predicted nucleic acid-binding protein
MDFVVDANILFAALIKKGVTAELLLNDAFSLFAPEFILEEFLDHKEEILQKTKRAESDFMQILKILESIISFVPKEEFKQFLEEAEKVCPDKDDTVYFALALKLNCAVWSNEKKLKEQSRVAVYSTADLLKIFYKH